jgi:ribosomal protein S18 acetylase RimI-like enzyme
LIYLARTYDHVRADVYLEAGMMIREFDIGLDYAHVRALWEQAGPGIQLSPSDEPAEIEKKLTRDPDLSLVMEEEGQILGSVIGGYDGRRGMMYHLAVKPERRGEGIGKALMFELEDRLRRKGCFKYYLLVRKEAREALGFYRSMGCEVMDLEILGKVLR